VQTQRHTNTTDQCTHAFAIASVSKYKTSDEKRILTTDCLAGVRSGHSPHKQNWCQVPVNKWLCAKDRFQAPSRWTVVELYAIEVQPPSAVISHTTLTDTNIHPRRHFYLCHFTYIYCNIYLFIVITSLSIFFVAVGAAAIRKNCEFLWNQISIL